MKPHELKGLTEDGLKLVVNHINKEVGRADKYDELNRTAEGQFLVYELEDRLKLARELYQHIEPISEHAVIMLATVQSYEREALEWLNRIKIGKNRIEELKDDLDMIGKMVKNKKNKIKRKDHKFVVDKKEIDNG